MDMSPMIDINCDLGEGYGKDDELMPLLSSCNIACGGHFGDIDSMITAVRLAQKHKVKIGAHPSFPDRENFGRKILTIDTEALKKSVTEQILQLNRICEKEQIQIHHVKLHGALYNLAATDKKTAELVNEALIETKLNFKVYAPYGSVLSTIIQPHFKVVNEAFIDRKYNNDLSLVPRSGSGALITDKEQVWTQFSQMIKNRSVTTVQGPVVSIEAETFCIHGDTPGATEILVYIHQKLKALKIPISNHA